MGSKGKGTSKSPPKPVVMVTLFLASSGYSSLACPRQRAGRWQFPSSVVRCKTCVQDWKTWNFLSGLKKKKFSVDENRRRHRSGEADVALGVTQVKQEMPVTRSGDRCIESWICRFGVRRKIWARYLDLETTWVRRVIDNFGRGGGGGGGP